MNKLSFFLTETGATVKAAIKVLKDHGVQEKNIVFVNLFSSYKGKNNRALRGDLQYC